ncbi:unnamed protein product [Leuciscus chuanchicus]
MCIRTQILLVLLVHVVSSIPSGCPERCVCDDQHVVQCAEQDLRRFPTRLPLTTRQLILSNNRISDLPALELNFLSDLMYLDCSNNSLTHISESTFGNLRKLAYLDLSFNSFGKIEEQTFRALESLVMLRLTDNSRLSEFHPHAFSHTSALQVLDISRNNLSRLNVSSLMALGGLRSLGLSGNPWLCACDTEELCLWMHTETVKFQGAGPPSDLDMSRIRLTTSCVVVMSRHRFSIWSGYGLDPADYIMRCGRVKAQVLHLVWIRPGSS